MTRDLWVMSSTEVPGYFRVVPLGRKERLRYEILSAPRRKERPRYDILSVPRKGQHENSPALQCRE